jgi:two-component system CheB/CheR fusion protein
MAELAPVLSLLRERLNLDFASYRPGTVERRIRRRMALVECPDAAIYTARLAADPEELEFLRHDLLIGVTEFFREPEAFAWLGERILREMLREPDREEFRAWCAGCATGEEAYSIAILLDETARAVGFAGRLSVFATDVHPKALEIAGYGRYEEKKLAALGADRLARHFVPDREGHRRVSTELRSRVVFAPHDILVDPPFTRIDLVVCRNLLIYLEPEAQERVVARFHHALRKGGVMFLGASESPGRHSAEFEILEARHKLFRKKSDRRLPIEPRRVPNPQPAAHVASNGTVPLATPPATAPVSRHLLRAYDQLLQRHVPPGYLVDSSGALLHCFGDAGRLLLPPEGRVENHLLARTSGDFRLALSTLIPRALRADGRVEARGVRVSLPDGTVETHHVFAEAINDPGQGATLVHLVLERDGAPGPAPAPSPSPAGFAPEQARGDRLADLEAELQTTRESLQATVEQLQTANEELQSTNEEMLAANEELQAANEELHSLNEELHSVNSEFERKNSELRQLNSDLDNLLGALEVGTLFLDRDLRIRKFNPAIGRCFHLLPQDVGRPISHIAYQLDDQDRLLADVGRVLAQGGVVRRELRTRDGHWFLERILPFRDQKGEIDGVVITFTDITAVRHMQERFDLAIEASRLVWWDWDVGRDQLTTNTAGWCILGYDFACASRGGAEWLELVHPDDRERVRASLESALRGDAPVWDCEHRFETRAGAWLWVANKGRVTERDAHGKPLRMLGTTQDIDARKSAEIAVARDLELLAHVPDAVICVDPAGQITYWNQAATALYGWQSSEVLGRPLVNVFPTEARADVTTILNEALSGRDLGGEFENHRKDGSRVWVDARSHRLLDQEGRLFGVMCISRDVTAARRDRDERARIERQLAQSQKMETLGNLAGGIAHDFNNLLAAILGYSEIASGLLAEGHPALGKLANVRHAGQRAAELVRRILAFSRAGEQPRRPIRVAQVVEETLPLLRASLPSTIEIRSRVAPDADQSVLGDHTQLQQVLLNLCTNAAQAIGDRNGGRLEITLDPVELAEPPPLHVGAISAGPALLLVVADNGCGIPTTTVERIFEPFFTTKPVGEGTGLGLSIVQSIIAAHEGGIHVDSSPDSGTRFRIYLPALPETSDVPPAPRAPRGDGSAFPSGRGERVAVIDDEESVALLTQQALERYGYAAEIMPDAPTCLEALRARPDAFALVVTDQTMPLMTGLELVQALRADSIQTPVIILSGYSRALDTAALPALGRVGFLAKPFVLADLLEHVHAIVRPRAGG